MNYDPHDPASVNAEEAWRFGRDQFRQDAWQWVLRDARGRLVLAEILLSTGMTSPSWVPGSFDGTAYKEGQRSIGLALRQNIELKSPELLPDIDASMRGLVSDVGSGGGDRSE